MNFKINGRKGITLIALVITIIVLLILAGITIVTLTGDNGILTKATKAKEKTEQAKVEEIVKISVNDLIASNNGKTEGITPQAVAENINKMEKRTDVYAEKNEFPTNIIFREEERKVEVNITVPEETLITFTIEGDTFNAVEGMTWRDWCESPYNTVGFEESGIEVVNYTTGATVTSGMRDDFVDSTSLIINGHDYGLQGFAECVYPDSKILVSMNDEVTIAYEIKENDDIVYFDFREHTTKLGKVSKIYVHKAATNFVKYIFEDGSYLQATDYHPIYTKEGWKSLTNRNGYERPQIGDEVKSEKGWKKLINIEKYVDEKDCYDFEVVSEDGQKMYNYFANGTLVQGSY